MFLTTKDLAERYKIAKSTVYELSERGKLPMPLKIGVSKRWKLSDIEAFEKDIS